MGVGRAQLLAVVRSEIDHGDGRACPADPSGFGQGQQRFLRIVQHLVEHDRIETGIGKR